MTSYSLITKAQKVHKIITQRYTNRGPYKDVIFETLSGGWYLHLSDISFFLGMEEPNIQTGDTIEVVLQKVETAKDNAHDDV